MSNPGKIYKTDTGQYALVIDKEQMEVFLQLNKLACHIYEDELLQKKVHHRAVLKHINRLTLIGYKD